VTVSPGGLHYRKNRPNAFTFSVMFGPTALGCYWSAYKNQEANSYIEYAKSQMDYVLCDNPTGKSYMIGYDGDGTQPFWKVVHHRGAYGAWRSFQHFVKTLPIYRPVSVRHTLYGGVLLGNNAPQDSFQANVMHHYHTEIAIYNNASAQGVLACLIANGHGNGKPMDDALFPPKAKRNNNTDLYTTDREFFVIARLVDEANGKTKIEAELHNRTRWPARRTTGLSFRYYFTLDEGMPKEDVHTEIITSEVPAALTPLQWTSDRKGYIEIAFPNDTIGPFASGKKWSNYRTVQFHIGGPESSNWDRSNDWSGKGLKFEKALLPSIPVYQGKKLLGGSEPQ
jgi:endoglucanase